MTKRTDKPLWEVVNNPNRPSTTQTGSGGGSGGGGTGKQLLQRFGEYAIIDNAFHQIKLVKPGRDDQSTVEIPLCDFHYWIIEEIVCDTGLEDQAFMRIEGQRKDGRALPQIEVPAAKYFSTQSSWANDGWGLRVLIYKGTQKKDALREAGHLYSRIKHEGEIPRRIIYKFTGFVRIGEQWAYLTGGGAITAEGLRDDVQVDLGAGHMRYYALPAPIGGDAIKSTAEILTTLLHICPSKPAIGAVLLAAVARAPLPGELQ